MKNCGSIAGKCAGGSRTAGSAGSGAKSRAGGRGFTLFTALVSFLLIALAMLLVQSMIRGESNTIGILADIREQAEMEAVADLARGDSLQVFNYGLRYSMEEHFIDRHVYYLMPADNAGDWDAIQLDFAHTFFGVCLPTEPDCESEKFAWRLTMHLLDILSSSTDFATYKITVEAEEETALRDAVKEMVNKSALGEDFFELVACGTGGFDDCTGSFYINLDTSGMGDAVYEDLPRITVSSTITGRALQKPVLPRGNFRIYIPLRVFKAIAGANEIAQGIQGLHPQIAGMCDSSEGWLKNGAKDKVKQKISSITSGWDTTEMGVDVGEIGFDVETRQRSSCTGCTESGNEPESTMSTCYEVSGIGLKIPFTEKNHDYMVNDTHEGPPSAQAYRVQLREAFPAGE